MSHKELYKSAKAYVYVREFNEHSILWFENGLGEPRACIIFIHTGVYFPEIWEAQIPLQSYPLAEFKDLMGIVEDYLKERNVSKVFGYTNKRMGDFLVLADERFKWGDDTIQVGYNEKRKVVWDI